MQAPCHAPRLGESADEDGEVFTAHYEIGQVPLGTHEKDAFLTVHVLVEVDNVPVVFGNKGGDGTDKPGLVRAVDQQNGGGHGRELANRKQTVNTLKQLMANPERLRIGTMCNPQESKLYFEFL